MSSASQAQWIQYVGLIEPILTPAQVAETTSEARWHQLYSVPKREPIKGQHAAALAASGVFFQPEPLVPFEWFKELSTPKRFPPRLQAGSNPAFFPDPFPFIIIDWFVPLSEPKRFPPRLGAGSNPSWFYHPWPVIDVSWFMPLSEPKRFPRRLEAGSNPYLFMGTDPVVGLAIDMDWFVPWSVPRRSAWDRRLPEYPFLSYSTTFIWRSNPNRPLYRAGARGVRSGTFWKGRAN